MSATDVFDARLARIVMLPDKDRVDKALTTYMGKPAAEFNRAMFALSLPVQAAAEHGVQITPAGFRTGAESTPFDLDWHLVESTTVRALLLHVQKPEGDDEKLPCDCGEQPDTVYIAVAPPVLPELWQLNMVNHSPNPNSNTHQGLESLVGDLAEYALGFLTKVQQRRFEGVKDPSTGDVVRQPVAQVLQAATWGFNVHVIGYGFGGALAQILALKLQKVTSIDFHLHLVTFGAPAVAREGVAFKLASVRRFAHAGDPFARLMPPSLGYVHIGPALDEDTRVEYGGRRAAQICQELSCHTAYLGVDFRDRALMEFYSKIPMTIAVLMLPKFSGKDLEDLWSLAYQESRLLTAEGGVPCPWVIVMGKEGKK
jgi:hypothetical protein